MINRIELCGNIASGKSTFTKACGEAGYNIALENFSSVPFLDDFYRNPAEFAFETETSFTLLHYYQLKTMNSFGFADFSLITDYAFALTTLTENEFSIYEKMFDYIIGKVGTPQKVIFLETSVETLLGRISKRGRKSENSITADYLLTVKRNIQLAYEKKYVSVPFKVINTEEISEVEYNIHLISGFIK